MAPSSTNDDLLHRIANYLVINASFTCSLGLFHGKMGIVIFFYHYARYSQNPIYEEFADELLGEVYEDIHADLLVNFEDGLCGIGWGFEYLERLNFVEGDIAGALEGIDSKIMERDLSRITDFTFQKGLKGILYYVLVRLSRKHDDNNLLFDRVYLDDLKHVIQISDLSNGNEIPWYSTDSLIQQLSGQSNDLSSLSLPDMLFSDLPEVQEDLSELPLGIVKGLSGIGLQFMLKKHMIISVSNID